MDNIYKTIYKCNICNKKYNSFEEAEKCENEHKKIILSIVGVEHHKNSIIYETLPESLTIKASIDGKEKIIKIFPIY